MMGFSSLHPGWGIGALDIKTAFLHASLDDEDDGIILVKPPALLAMLGLIPEGVYWKKGRKSCTVSVREPRNGLNIEMLKWKKRRLTQSIRMETPQLRKLAVNNAEHARTYGRSQRMAM